jgi:hypothetical protein
MATISRFIKTCKQSPLSTKNMKIYDFHSSPDSSFTAVKLEQPIAVQALLALLRKNENQRFWQAAPALPPNPFKLKLMAVTLRLGEAQFRETKAGRHCNSSHACLSRINQVFLK